VGEEVRSSPATVAEARERCEEAAVTPPQPRVAGGAGEEERGSGGSWTMRWWTVGSEEDEAPVTRSGRSLEKAKRKEAVVRCLTQSLKRFFRKEKETVVNTFYVTERNGRKNC
jgi:hypothetical protein